MDNLNLDIYLKIVNEEKRKKGLNNYIPIYPMLRIEKEKLYVGVMLVNENDNVWDKDNSIKPEYWVLIDINSNKILEFNKTSDKEFINGELKEKKDNKQKEISKYSVEKAIEYQNYLMEDIKKSELPIQKKLSNILNNEIIVDGEKVNINDYIMANIETEVKNKVNELVDILVREKYNSIIIYYDNLFNQIIDEYKNDNNINIEKVNLCIEIMNNYYDGVVGIDNFFNN